MTKVCNVEIKRNELQCHEKYLEVVNLKGEFSKISQARLLFFVGKKNEYFFCTISKKKGKL